MTESVYISNNKYNVIKKLGSGVYGRVYKVQDENGKNYALKISKKDIASFIEVDLMMKINHPHIVKAYDIKIDDINLYLLEEYCEYNLSTVIINNSLDDKIRIIFQIGIALQFLLDNNIVHCDVKPSNILINENDKIKVGDLGIASHISLFDNDRECEAEYYRAPEYLRDKYNIKNNDVKKSFLNRNIIQGEIWSFGMLCLDILFGREAFLIEKNCRPMSITMIDGIGIIPYINKKEKPKSEYRDIINLIVNKLLEVDISKRVKSFNEFLQDDIFLSKNFQLIPNIGIFNINDGKKLDIIKENINDFWMANHWLLELLTQFSMPNIICFSIMEFIKCKWNKYTSNKKTIQLFIVAVLYLVYRIYKNDEISLEDLSYVSGNQYKPEEIEKKVYEIFMRENGIIINLTLYDYLQSAQMLEIVLDMIINNDSKYYEYDSKNLANLIILNETNYETNNRISKDKIEFVEMMEKHMNELGEKLS